MITLIIIGILFLIDLYVYQGVKVTVSESSAGVKRAVFLIYWAITLLSLAGVVAFRSIPGVTETRMLRNTILLGVFINYVSKVFALSFLVIDDVIRAGQWTFKQFSFGKNATPHGDSISRSEFLARGAVVAGMLPVVTMGYGIAFGAHNYRVRRLSIPIKHLPGAFHGIQIAHISDIHSGSFYSQRAVLHGVEQVLELKPDLIFFTGDLVNSDSKEIEPYFNVFKKLQAPEGVFSVLGNHDYGDYKQWPSAKAKRENLERMHAAHGTLGWKLLNNEHYMLKEGGEQLAIIGNENWGAGRFSKYGDLEKAHQGTEEASVKLLLSHDPSHWDAQILSDFPDIDVTFAGHTHGFQFGIETELFRWSPAQYAYKQWAGLYTKQDQHIYVNRGFGYIGFPGRVGIPPEITLITLEKSS